MTPELEQALERCCCTCKRSKSLKDFHKGAKRCKKCQREYMATYYQIHQSTIKARSAQYRAAHPGYDRESKRRWERSEAGRAWRVDRDAKYRGERVEFVDRFQIYDRDEGICGICGGPADREDFHLDHIVPLARGGRHCKSNTQVAHPRCNQKKGAKCLT